MAPKNRFVSEYKANFKQHEIRLALERQQQIQNQDKSPVHVPLRAEEKTGDDPKRKPAQPKQKENLALRYKAGLAPTLPVQNKLRYLSEYQKQFEWKRPLEREAPILSAEKMIYGGQDGNPSRATKLNLPKKTEYQLQFVRHPIITSPETKELEKEQNLPMYSPVGYQDAQVAAGKPSVKAPPPILPKKSIVFQSEYHANFKSPSKYEYAKGSWLGADPPQLHHPDEKSDSDTKPSSNAWYQQVLELREKVQSYRSRAREGSHFLSLLKDLQKYEKETQNEEKPMNTQEPVEPPMKPETPRTETTRKSTPVIERRDEDAPESSAKPDVGLAKDERRTYNKDPIPEPRPAAHSGAEVAKEDRLFWDKTRAIPGPSLKKVHSLETLSHESTLSNGSSRNSAEEPPPVGRRQAWPEERHRVNRTHVIPPYYTSESSNGDLDDTRSDVTISDMEHSNVDNPDLSYNEKPVHQQATRKLFTGKRQVIGDIRKDIDDGRKDKDDGRKVIGKIGDDRELIGYNRRNIGDDRIGDDRKRVSSFSSDDEKSCSSFISQSSSILSIEAMDKRRALASETLQRAIKRRQAQV